MSEKLLTVLIVFRGREFMVRTRTQHFVLAASSVLSVPKWILRHRSNETLYRWKRKLNGNRLNKIAVEAFTLNLIRKKLHQPLLRYVEHAQLAFQAQCKCEARRKMCTFN